MPIYGTLGCYAPGAAGMTTDNVLCKFVVNGQIIVEDRQGGRQLGAYRLLRLLLHRFPSIWACCIVAGYIWLIKGC